MKTLIGVFVSLTWLSGVVSSDQLVQSDSAVIRPGNSHTMTCQDSGGFAIAGYTIHWIRHFSDGRLQWLCYIGSGGSTRYNDAVKGRFTVTRDNNSNKLTLKMDNMKTEDTAVYYCARHSGGYFDLWSKGSYVEVTTAVVTSPSVFPMVPCSVTESSTEVTIGCLSTGYFPTGIDVNWNSGAITTGIKNHLDIRTTNGNYVSTSLLTISVSDFRSKKYACNVNHKESKKTINRDISVTPSSTTVEVMQSSCGINGFVDLVCFISGHSSKDINLEWRQNGNRVNLQATTNKQEKFTSSKLSVPKNEWDNGKIYTCGVQNSSSTQKSISKCAEASSLHPKIVLHPASTKDLLTTEESNLICEVSGLKSSLSLNIKWKRSDGKTAQGVTTPPTRNHNGGYTVQSTLNIRNSEWRAGVSFTCTAEHPDLKSPMKESVKEIEGELREPTIYIFPPPNGELSNDMLGVTCLIKGFNHLDIYVEWKKNNVIIGEDLYHNTKPIYISPDNETYIMFSTVFVHKSDWCRGATFTCLGGIRKTTSRDIKRQNGKCR